MTNKLLKLPSQRQLVDRLLHLIEFNHPFVFLSGKPGCGRGTLCESLLGVLPEKVRVVSLIGTPAMKMVDVRQLLLPQVVARPLFNPQDALAESFFRMLEGSKPATLLLMIERATSCPPSCWGSCGRSSVIMIPWRRRISWLLSSRAVTSGVAVNDRS